MNSTNMKTFKNLSSRYMLKVVKFSDRSIYHFWVIKIFRIADKSDRSFPSLIDLKKVHLKISQKPFLVLAKKYKRLIWTFAIKIKISFWHNCRALFVGAFLFCNIFQNYHDTAHLWATASGNRSYNRAHKIFFAHKNF